MEDMDPTNGSVLGWMWRVVEDVLVPLHQVHPLRGVRFGG